MILENGDNGVVSDNIKVEILGEWDNWQNAYEMKLIKKYDEIRVWSAEMLIEEKT